MLLSYELTTFQILRQKFVKSFVGILVQMITPKGHFEIKWPLNYSILIHEIRIWLQKLVDQFLHFRTLHMQCIFPRTTDTQWRHKSKRSEIFGRCGGCALDKQSLRNKLVNRETVIYMYVSEKYPSEKAVGVKRQLHSKA